MEGTTDYPFPHGTVLKKFEGTIYRIGDMQFRPTKIRNEYVEVGGMARRDATFDAENIKTGEPVILKLRVESDPAVHCEPSDLAGYRSRGLQLFREEVDQFKQATSSGYTPDYIVDAELQQDDRYEYPGGYLGVLILSKNPNYTVNVRDAMLAHELKRSDLKLLTKRWEEMFRTFRDRGLRSFAMDSQMDYEPDTKRPYMLLPEFIKIEPGQPPSSKLYEMQGIEDMIKELFDDETWTEISGEVSFQTRPTW